MTQIRELCSTLPRIDTHAHFDENYPSLEEFSKTHTAEQLLNSRVIAEGCRVLYDENVGVFLRPETPKIIFEKAEKLRKLGAWKAVNFALEKAKIEKQISFCAFKPESFLPFASNDKQNKISYLAFVDEAINGAGQIPNPDFPEGDTTFYSRICNLFGEFKSFDDYLDFINNTVDNWRAKRVVGMKTAAAYTSGLKISKPSLKEASTAFSKKNKMSGEDYRTARDYVFHHLLRACLRNNFPVVIHTGFQIWGRANLEQSNPMLLHNILVDPDYKNLTFVLLHGGNPYTGETTYLAGMFPNVIIDFTWITWMTPIRFKNALLEWLAIVPNHKFCWGSDSQTPESIVGIDSITRRYIADALEMAVAERIIDEKYALEFIENSYKKNAERIFGV
ncbi:MAG: hypothetical protein DRI44_08195 [Chlamydiae bacterium]|nr:MAG: hypothetical protein DRI44_08195 [Chlamydiota bacterium]